MTEVVHSDTYPGIEPSKLNMNGKYVFISGASRGLGRAMAVSITKAGASFIAIGGRSDFTATTEAIREAAAAVGKPTPVVLPLNFEVTDPAAVDAAVAKIRAEFGRIDIVINNAGISGTMTKIAEKDPEEFRQVLDVNINGPYLITRAFIPLMLEAGGDKTFLQIASVGAHILLPGMAAYLVSKAGLMRFAQIIDSEYADQGILAYTIHPGNIRTEILDDFTIDPTITVGKFDSFRTFVRSHPILEAGIKADTKTYSPVHSVGRNSRAGWRFRRMAGFAEARVARWPVY